MSAGNVTLADTTLEVLAAKMITALTQVAASHNVSIEGNFKKAIDAQKQRNLWNQGMGFPQEQPLTPPMIWIVNEDLVRQNEQGTGEKNYAGVFFEVPYVFIPPPAAPHPSVVIGGPTFGYPGFFDTVGQGDSPAIPVGTEVKQDGHTYRKTAVGLSLIGFATRWQQVA